MNLQLNCRMSTASWCFVQGGNSQVRIAPVQSHRSLVRVASFLFLAL